MRLVLIFISLCIATISFGQFNYQGKFIDVNTNRAIEGVNVKIKNEKRGEVSAKNGSFQLEIKRLPTTILISHIAYETEELLIEAEQEEEVLIFLVPKVNVLSEVTVREKTQIQSISDVEKYSVLDFALSDDQVFRLEYHGSFKKYVLSVTDIFGEENHSLRLGAIKKVRGLYKSCDELLYLLSASHAYPLRNEDHQLSLGTKIRIDTFDRFIRPCQLKIGTALYYINKKYNGLMSIVTKYDFARLVKTRLRVIADEGQLENYQTDINLIAESQGISNIAHTGDDCDNDQIRNIQENGDFLFTVFYKPEYPTYICKQQERLILLNHMEQKIEHFQEGEADLESEVKADYVLDKKWLKKIIIDSKTEKVYGVFDLKKGIGIKEINTSTGETQLVSILETATQNHETIKIQEGRIFYLKEYEVNTGLMELVQQKI